MKKALTLSFNFDNVDWKKNNLNTGFEVLLNQTIKFKTFGTRGHDETLSKKKTNWRLFETPYIASLTSAYSI